MNVCLLLLTIDLRETTVHGQDRAIRVGEASKPGAQSPGTRSRGESLEQAGLQWRGSSYTSRHDQQLGWSGQPPEAHGKASVIPVRCYWLLPAESFPAEPRPALSWPTRHYDW